MAELRRISPLALEHLPPAISLLEVMLEHFPDLPQILCFDTAFHSRMPRVAKILPIPRKYQEQGVQRYGFHGLSYEYLIAELARLAGEKAARGRVILAHFGNGASLAAVKDGVGVDTSMGFTPAAGIVMGRRTGDIDPGLVWFLARTTGMTPDAFHKMTNQESGMLGVSGGVSNDMRDLLSREKTDDRCADAVNLFCYEAKKRIGSYAAAIGGLDTLVFAGGIGENAPEIRRRVCEGLEFLGITLEPSRNASRAPIISTDSSRVSVRVIPTDEEIVIARAVYASIV
jgi:acetate kinase